MELYPGGIQALTLILDLLITCSFLFIFLFLLGASAVSPSDCKLPEGRVLAEGACRINLSVTFITYCWLPGFWEKGNVVMSKLGLHLTLCKSNLVAMEGPGLSLRYCSSSGHERWHWWWGIREIWERRCEVLEETHGFLFWLAGRIVDICPQGLSSKDWPLPWNWF